jgi:phosphate:Na+ symporter
MALAGFGLIFVGIDVLQQGMTTLSQRIDPAALPTATLTGRLLLVAAGVVMTVVMQSSSAAVATTLAALHTGTISVEQAAALVVGQSIGTTVTSGLAAIGASVPARRAAAAHVLFNLGTGAIAFLLIPAAIQLEFMLGARLGVTEPALFIAAFHTGFTLVGLLLFAPFLTNLTGWVERLVPDTAPAIGRHLDSSVAGVPEVALEAARRAVMETCDVVFSVLHAALDSPRRAAVVDPELLDEAVAALHRTRRFLTAVQTPEQAAEHARHISLHHAMDHVERLVERLRFHTPDGPVEDAIFDELRGEAGTVVAGARAWLNGSVADPAGGPEAAARCAGLSAEVATRRRTDRERTLASTATGALDPDLAGSNLAAMRWLDSSLYHVWRAVHHLVVPDPVAAA